MPAHHWSRAEVEAIVDDYLSMLKSELAGVPYNKAAHRRRLKIRLTGRSDASIEYKHANISAALMDVGFPAIAGYKRRDNYQAMIGEVLADRLTSDGHLAELAAADAERPITVPEVDDILAVLSPRPGPAGPILQVAEPRAIRLGTNYLEREARNRSLGSAGELFAINYERARLIHGGKAALAARIEHTARVRGDYEGYDVLSYELDGRERLIEVKTTKYGVDTPFFVTRNEVSVSELRADSYQVYRLFGFRQSPRLYVLGGAISASCRLEATTFVATPG